MTTVTTRLSRLISGQAWRATATKYDFLLLGANVTLTDRLLQHSWISSYLAASLTSEVTSTYSLKKCTFLVGSREGGHLVR